MFINQQQTKGMKLTANPAWLSLPPNLGKGSEAQFLRIMKLTTIIILAACLHTSAKGVAQQTITFSGKEVSLESVFSAIKKQTNYRFFFNTDMLTNASKVTLDVKNAQIEQVMNMALKDQPLTFTIKGRTIFVMKKVEEEKKGVMVAPTGDPITVSGRVTDENGDPLAGANVKVKGGNNGVTTDGQGRFTLNNVDPNASLEVSFVGRETEILSVKGKTVFSVALGQRQSILDETVVIAYGTTTKRFNTGNISSIKAADIDKQPVNNLLLTLQGRVPGLFITQANGISGSGVTVRIQGQNSILNGNDPLYVIDGVPLFFQLPSTGLDGILGTSGAGTGVRAAGSPLSYINPSDIESIEVLKDADATAIYGSRAANGAILITTKKGKSGKVKLDFKVQQGWGAVTRKMPMLDTRQYLDMRYEAYRNDGIELSTLSPNSSNIDLLQWDTTRFTDWQKNLIGNTASYTSINSGISGGTALLQYLFSATYHRETTVFPLPSEFADEKGSVHLNITSNSANQKFKVQFTSNYLIDNNLLPQSDLTQLALPMEPIAPMIYNEDGTLNWELNSDGAATWQNPLQYKLIKYKNKTTNFINNLVLNYRVVDGLEIGSSFGYSVLQTNDFSGTPLVAIMPQDRPNSQRTSSFGNRDLSSWIVEPQISYKTNLSNIKISAIIGSTIQQNNTKGNQISARGFNSDEILENLSAATTISGSSYVAQYKYNALFGRLNLQFLDKYIINFSARRDGSSRFGVESQFNNFGSIGVAWIISEEKFVKENLRFISFAKIKGSYGTTGSDQIEDYKYLNLYGSFGFGNPYQNVPALYPRGLANPYLEWEETKKLQGGVEVGLIKDRVLIGITYARNRSSNQLLSYSLPTITGFGAITTNFPATVQNASWEGSIQSTNIVNRKFKWTSSFNLTIPRNKLIAFPNLEMSSYSRRLIINQPLVFTRASRFLGADPVTGIYQVLDSNGNATFTPTFPGDYPLLVTTYPKFYGGFQNSFTYGKFNIDFLVQFVKQVAPVMTFGNGFRTPGQFRAGTSNQPKTVINRWQKPGDITNIQKYSTLDDNSIAFASDAGYGDASFIRLKNLAISWQLPNIWSDNIRLRDCRVFVQGQNLLTFTDYEGMDPESQSVSQLPPLRILTVGFQVGF